MTTEHQDCATCRFFAASEAGSGGSGDCRRHAPVIVQRAYVNGLDDAVPYDDTEWPQVGEAQWCGDWRDGATGPEFAEVSGAELRDALEYLGWALFATIICGVVADMALRA